MVAVLCGFWWFYVDTWLCRWQSVMAAQPQLTRMLSDSFFPHLSHHSGIIRKLTQLPGGPNGEGEDLGDIRAQPDGL